MAVEIAYDTEAWKRPTEVAVSQRMKTGFSSAIQHSLKDLPEGTAEIIGRLVHPSV